MKEKIDINQLIFIDLETTGLNPRRGHRVIEVGAVIVRDGMIRDVFHSLVNPSRSISASASKVHGITGEKLRNQPAPEEVFPELKNTIGRKVLAAHNAPFDMAFLRMEFGRLGIVLDNTYICTLELSRRYFPDLPNHKLGTIYHHLFKMSEGISGDESRTESQIQEHRVLDDARMAAAIWQAMENGR